MMAAVAMTRRADMFTADGRPSDDDPRENGPRLGDERATLAEALRREMMAGQDAPRRFCSETDRDGDFNGAVPDPQVVAEAWDAWRAEVDFATRFVAGAASLDITADDPLNQHGSGGGPMSLREVPVGVIEEYARHNGHADLLRERIDGRIGQ
jgi:Protein of unknown function (DUF664)